MVSQEAWLPNRRMQTELVLLLLLSHLSGVLLTPVDLTNRTDVGGLVQDHHIDLDWLGTLLKGFGPVLVPQPTPESAVAGNSQSDNRADADVGDHSQSESIVDAAEGDDSQSDNRVDADVGDDSQSESRADADVGDDSQSDNRVDADVGDDSQSESRVDADVGDDSQSESRVDADVGDDSQSESRLDADVGGVPKEETLNRKRLSVDSDFLKALLSSDDESTADQGGSAGPLNNGVKIRLEEESTAGATENYAAQIEGLVAPSLTVTENIEKGATESSGGKIRESVTATPKQDEYAANTNDEDNTGGNTEGNSAKDNAAEDTESDNTIDESAEEVLGTDSPIIPSWYNSQEYDADLYPYTGWEDPWEGWGWPVLPTEAPDTMPEQIHISWGNASSQMVVMWSTKSHGTGRVQYGIAPGNYSQEVAADYNNFWYGNNEGLQHIYRAVLMGLLPGRTYSYKVLCDEDVSPGFQFTAKRDDLNWSPELLVYGDMGRVGGAPSLARLTHEAETGKYAAVLHVGDFAYDLHTEGGKYGDDFMNRIQDIATKLPYMTCPGNHEIEFDFNPYLTRFSMPQSPWPGTMDKMWYSFNLGRAHFISYSSEVYFTDSPAEEQYKWLLQDLAEANSAENRTLHPWIIAFGHRPMYCSNVDGDDCTTAKSRVRAGLEDLFYQQGVDIIIEAHEHSYERLWPVYNYTLVDTHYRDPRAPVHIISGAAGCNEFDGVCVNPMMGPKGPWSAYRAWVPGLYGYGRLRVQNSTHVHWEQVLAVNGQVIDSAQVIQHRHGPFGEE